MSQQGRVKLEHVLGFVFLLALTASSPDVLLASDSDVDRLHYKDEETPLETGGEVAVVATLDYSSASRYSYQWSKWLVNLTISNPSDDLLQLGESVIVVDKQRESTEYIGCWFGRRRDPDSVHLRDMTKRYDLNVGYAAETSGDWNSGWVCNKSGNCEFKRGSVPVYDDFGFGRVSPRSKRTFNVEISCPVSWADPKVREYVAVVSPTIRALDHEKPQEADVWTFRGLLDGLFGNDQTQERHGTSRTPYPRLFVLEFLFTDPPPDDPVEPRSVEAISLDVQSLKELVERSDSEFWRRLFAMNFLAENHQEAALNVLIDVLKNDKQPSLLRAAAADNLGHRQTSSAVEPLITAVEETDNAALRNRFLYALGDIGDPAAASVIRKYLRDQDSQLTAVAAAAKVGDDKAIPILISILNDSDAENRRRAAADALVQIGNEPALTALIAVLEDPASADRVLAARELANADAAAVVPSLASIARESTAPEELRKEVMVSLGTLGGADARATLEAILLASETTEELRIEACRSLGKIGDLASVPVLSGVAEDAAAPEELRDEALTSLGTVGGNKARATLETILLASETATKLRLTACRSLGKISDDASVPVLSKAVNSKDGSVSACALKQLAEVGDAHVQKDITSALASAHDQTRSTAADELKRRGVQGAVTALWSAYRKETEQGTAQSMAEALMGLQFAQPDATTWLAERLGREGNNLWWEDIRLLRHLTGEVFGPDRKWVDDNERDEAIRKWQQWMIGEGLLERRGEKSER